MSVFRLKFQQVLHILRVFGTFTNTWPPYPDAGKNELLLRDLYYHVTIFVSVWMVWIPMAISTYKSRNDVIMVMKSISHLAATAEAILNSILCRINRRQLQSLLVSIEKFVKVSEDRERIILQKYVDRYSTFVSAVATSFIVAGISVVCAPLFLPLEFPTDVWYPFSTEPLLRKSILYVMQIFVVAHTVSCLGVDIMIAVLLFYSTARLEMLAFEVQRATDETDVISCIKKHQEITEFVSKTQHAIQRLLFKTTLTMGFTVISGCFPILYIQSHVLIPQFLSMIMAALQRMYITAWPADDLKEVSTRLSWAVYGTSWVGKSQRMRNDILIMIQRSQKPLLIFMGGLLPALTMEYYASFLTTVLSYFMTMRAAIGT